jgi:ABC-type multidrug transport system fused ATPase/permease subunit
VFYLAFVQGAIYDVGDQWSKIQDALGSAREVFNLLDREPQLRVTRQHVEVEVQATEHSSGTNGDSSTSGAAAAAGIQFNDGACSAIVMYCYAIANDTAAQCSCVTITDILHLVHFRMCGYLAATCVDALRWCVLTALYVLY